MYVCVDGLGGEGGVGDGAPNPNPNNPNPILNSNPNPNPNPGPNPNPNPNPNPKELESVYDKEEMSQKELAAVKLHPLLLEQSYNTWRHCKQVSDSRTQPPKQDVHRLYLPF